MKRCFSKITVLWLAFVLSISMAACSQDITNGGTSSATTSLNEASTSSNTVQLKDIPEYSSDPYVVINGNEPFFEESDYTTEPFEEYSDLDSLGRCGVAYANICKEIMPTEDRQDINSVTPSGWVQHEYDFVDGGYLYNRCHLIGHQLAGEDANEKNLITGTRYLNIQGMLPFENMVADYVDETDNHVLYRVTPVYDGNNLVASGVLMEGWSVEDSGDGIGYNVYCYNVQPGVEIDYATGDNWESGDAGDSSSSSDATETTYILNTNSMKFHLPTCSSVEDISESNKETYSGNRDDLIDQGYEPCGRCNP